MYLLFRVPKRLNFPFKGKKIYIYIQKLSNAMTLTGHPGEDAQCRCCPLVLSAVPQPTSWVSPSPVVTPTPQLASTNCDDWL